MTNTQLANMPTSDSEIKNKGLRHPERSEWSNKSDFLT